ncbi:MAG: phosphonate metabolism transcriptional regulator PhnF [Limnochordaceae bacterium]|nr:phosphonate metabolism transcriptional regulator PhnF [Limnochordaceae bacterium]
MRGETQRMGESTQAQNGGGIPGDSRVPLYHRLHDQLRDDIESGVLRPGDRIPTEAELSARFGVSRTTVKQAIQRLVHAGLVYRVQGKGTFVSQPRIPRRFDGLISFHEEMRQRGHTLATELLEAGLVPAARHVASALGVSAGTPVVRITRRRLVDGAPIALQTSFLPGTMAELVDDPVVATGSLYEAMERRFGQRPTQGREEYTAVVVAGDDAARLGVPDGSPCLAVRRFAASGDGRPVEYTESLLRADRYTLHVELKSVPAGPPPRSAS